MKIRYNVNVCDCNTHRNELMIHFTKSCPNNCSFCIDKLNKGVATISPNVDAIIKTVDKYKSNVKNITISGGEPFIYINDLLRFVTWLKENTELNITIITSIPEICYKEKDKFFEILSKCDNLQISLQHHDQKIADLIRGTTSTFNRNEFYKEIINYLGPDKILGSINILKPYFESTVDITNNVWQFNKLGFKNIKLCEMFDADDVYIDIPKMMGIKMNSPFASGCKTEYKPAQKWELKAFDWKFDGHLYIKRSCFYRTKHQKASIWDFIKICTRWMFTKQYFFGVIHENGEIAPYWL